MKILKAQKHPELPFDVSTYEVDKILFIAGEKWLKKKMYKFGYDESFKNAGMIYPITVVCSKDYWDREKRLPKDNEGNIIEGLYVVTGHKRVLWARENGYEKIEGYKVSNVTDMGKIRTSTSIFHAEIPK